MALKIDLEVNGLTKDLVDATYLVMKRISGEWFLAESGILDVPYDEPFTIYVSDSVLFEFDNVMVIVTDCDGSNYGTAGTATDFIDVSEVYKDFSVVVQDDFFVRCDNRTLAYTSWDMGDGTIIDNEDPLHMYTDNGSFTITNADYSETVVITGVTKFLVELDGNTVTCTRQSGTDGNWSFGNGDTNDDESAVYTFYENGSYVVEYGGFSETVVVDYYTDMVDRVEGNVAYFSRPVGVTGSWGYGTGEEGVEDEHEYPQHGIYIAEVDGYFTVVRIAATEMPVVDFTTTIDSEDSAIVTFTGTGANDYVWEINGTEYTGNPLTVDFNDIGGGIYPVRCTGKDLVGNVGTALKNVVVQAVNISPVVSLTASINRLDVSFVATSSDTAGETLSHRWNMGDGNVFVSGKSVEHTYITSGLYTVTCTVTDDREPPLSTVSTLEITVTDEDSLAENLLLANNSDLAEMDGDPNELMSGFYYTPANFIFSNGECECPHNNNSSSGRITIDWNDLGLEEGSVYQAKVDLKSSSLSGSNTGFAAFTNGVILEGTVDGVATEGNYAYAPNDDAMHTITANFTCNNTIGQLRIVGTSTITLDNLSISKVI